MEVALYLEVNALFVFVLAVLIRSVKQASSSTLHERLLVNMLSLIAIIVATDCFTRISDCNPFPGSFAIGVVSNSIGFAVGAVVSLMWALYADYKCYTSTERLRRRLPFLAIPAVMQVVLALLSQPFHFIFYIDAACVYHRGPLFWMQAVVESYHLLYAGVVAFRCSRKERLKARRDECIMLATFGWFPLIGGIIQVVCYGLPTLWPMTICAMLLVVQNLQRNQISTDALTGLNNRGRLDQYLAAQAKEFDRYLSLYVILLDVDNFKGVNDCFGHIVGDATLVSVAACLKRATAKNGEFVARYGGDEFAIVCRCSSDLAMEGVEKEIRRQIRGYNEMCGEGQPKISVSIGYASLPRGQEDGVEQMLKEADNRMYEAKKRRHAMRVRT